MELKENSFLARYYKFMFNGSLPKDFCTLFWNTLIATFLLPIAIPAIIAKSEFWDRYPLILKALFGLVLWIVIGLLSFGGYDLMVKWGWIAKTDSKWWVIVGFFVLSGLIALILTGLLLATGVIIGGVEGVKYVNKQIRGNQPPTPSKLSIIWNTIRNKYCTKIDWKK